MRLPMDRAVLVLSLLVEGMSIRSAERISGHHRDTICRLLVLAGDKCASLLDRLLVDVEVDDVQADEIWGFTKMKERTKKEQGIDDPHVGDSWCFVGIERTSKLVLAHHLGRRTYNDTDLFVSKLARATADTYQLTTDAFEGYEYAVRMHLWGRVDYAQLIKQYGQDVEGARRKSPHAVVLSTRLAGADGCWARISMPCKARSLLQRRNRSSTWWSASPTTAPTTRSCASWPLPA